MSEPLRLYYFTTTKYALEAIWRRRLKVARILELNDPFEFLGPVYEDRVARAVANRWKLQMSERFGMICLSTDWHHPLLWGHYGDKHAGICLGFDVLKPESFREVEYTPLRPTLQELGIEALGNMSEEVMKRLLHLKFDAWHYEAEYRAFVKLRDEEAGLFFTDFGESLVLREVIVGQRSSATRADVAAVIGDLTGVRAFKARPGFQRFEVVENHEASMWADGDPDEPPTADPEVQLEYERALGSFILNFNRIEDLVTELLGSAKARLGMTSEGTMPKSFVPLRARLRETVSLLQRLDYPDIPADQILSLADDRNTLVHGYFDQNPFQGDDYVITGQGESRKWTAAEIRERADRANMLADKLRPARARFDFDDSNQAHGCSV